MAACGGAPSYASPGAAIGHESGLTPLSVQRVAALTVPRYVPRPVHPDHGASWMAPGADDKDLLYVGDWETNDVYVYDWPTGTSVGTLTGFDEPYGMCVDREGHVYITNFGSGRVYEYKHGGTSPIRTEGTAGYAIGCSVAEDGSVAATDFYTTTGAGQVVVFGDRFGSRGYSYADSSACYYMWPGGYDDEGNLIVSGENPSVNVASVRVCVLLARTDHMQTLSLSGGSIHFPGGTMWDGKHIAIADQEANGTSQTGIYQTTLSGTTLTVKGQTILSDDCYGDYVDVVDPFIAGMKNTPVNRRQGSLLVGSNLWCTDQGYGRVGVWHYPSGKPDFVLPSSPNEPYGEAVSIAR